jgi:hypothetical protein
MKFRATICVCKKNKDLIWQQKDLIEEEKKYQKPKEKY